MYIVGDALDKTEERLAYGIENNSTLLECTPRSLQAKVIWFVQKGRDTRKEEVIHSCIFTPCCLAYGV